MIQIEFNTLKNLLHVSFSGKVEVGHLKGCWPELESALAKLQPGFRVITDLSNMEAMEYSCSHEIKSFMDFCRDSGVGSVTRVIPDPTKDIGFSLMSIFHYRHSIPIATYSTLEEAMSKL